MNCPACGAEVVDGAKNCAQCGRELSLGTRSVAESEHVAKEAGAVAGKLGRGAVGGMKGLVAGANKELHRDKDEKPS